MSSKKIGKLEQTAVNELFSLQGLCSLQAHTDGYLVRIWDTETVRVGCGRRKTQVASSPTNGRNAGS